MKTKILELNYNYNITNYCVEELKKGNIGIFPTDTVYGIGCDALNINAIKKLYDAKNRNLNKPICILVSSIDMAKKFIKEANSIEEKLMRNFWPGSLTIVFNKSNIVPDLLTANLNTIGIRIPNNNLCLNIIDNFENPIAMSSANISDNLPDTDLNSLLIDFNNKVNFIINNKEQNNNIASTIVRVENNEIRILREGSITKEDIIKCFGGNINVR